MPLPLIRSGGAWVARPPRRVRFNGAWVNIKVLWERQLYFNGTDYEYRWVKVAVLSAPDQTPAAPGLEARTNWRTNATLALPSGDVGGWERTTWWPRVWYRNAFTLDPLGTYDLAIGATADLRTWDSGYEGTSVQAAYQWITEAGSGPLGAYSAAVTIGGGLG